MPFTNPIVGDKTLIREAIQSPDYDPGVSGWTINKDGSAEFRELTVAQGDIDALRNDLTVAEQDIIVAQETADGKIKTYTGDIAPTGTFTVGDLWRQTGLPAGGQRLHRWDGTAWVAVTWDDSSIFSMRVDKLLAGTIAVDVLMTAVTAQSTNWVSQTEGWKVDRSGSAEFNGDVFVKGDLQVGPSVVDGPSVEVIKSNFDNLAGEGNVLFHTGKIDETKPGKVSSYKTGSNGLARLEPPAFSNQAYPIVECQAGTTPTILLSRIGSSPGEVVIPSSMLAKFGDGMLATDTAMQTKETEEATTFNPTNTASYDSGPVNCGDSFVAPPSGKITLSWTADCRPDIDGAMWVSVEIREGATVGAGTLKHAVDDNKAIRIRANASNHHDAHSYVKMYDGLTPGITYNVRTMHKNSHSTGNQINYRRIHFRPEIG